MPPHPGVTNRGPASQNAGDTLTKGPQITDLAIELAPLKELIGIARRFASTPSSFMPEEGRQKLRRIRERRDELTAQDPDEARRISQEIGW